MSRLSMIDRVVQLEVTKELLTHEPGREMPRGLQNALVTGNELVFPLGGDFQLLCQLHRTDGQKDASRICAEIISPENKCMQQRSLSCDGDHVSELKAKLVELLDWSIQSIATDFQMMRASEDVLFKFFQTAGVTLESIFKVWSTFESRKAAESFDRLGIRILPSNFSEGAEFEERSLNPEAQLVKDRFVAAARKLVDEQIVLVAKGSIVYDSPVTAGERSERPRHIETGFMTYSAYLNELKGGILSHDLTYFKYDLVIELPEYLELCGYEYAAGEWRHRQV